VPPLAADDVKDVNTRYHDVAASDYDSKWGITYDERGAEQVLGKLRKALGTDAGPFRRSLEIGAGTGYFTLNLLLSGVVDEAVATDISQGMLDELDRSAARLGVSVGTARCEAAALPFEDDSFDLLLGHAVLHHLPDLDAAFAEFGRVLRPGGTLAFCGEPSRYGDMVAAVPKRFARAMAPAWRRVLGVGRRVNAGGHAPHHADHGLEHVVDQHAFTPADLDGYARRAGFGSVRVTGEELVSGWFGWANRTLESTAHREQIPSLWYQYAYRGYLALQALDTRVLEGRLPPAIFYNLLMSARLPGEPAASAGGAAGETRFAAAR
jgi:ubiquinone/menaquinone biosynthesis C-methylase UbiE